MFKGIDLKIPIRKKLNMESWLYMQRQHLHNNNFHEKKP